MYLIETVKNWTTQAWCLPYLICVNLKFRIGALYNKIRLNKAPKSTDELRYLAVEISEKSKLLAH